MAGGGRLRGEVRLPELPQVPPTRDSPGQRLGRVLADHLALTLGSGALLGVAGAAAGVAFGGGSPVLRAARGLGGLVAGVAGGLLVGAAAEEAGGGAGSSPGVRDVPGAPRDAAEPTTADHLRVLEWNVHGMRGTGGAGSTRATALAAVQATVAREHPDVLVLEEVSSDDLPGDRHDDLRELATALGATDAVFVPNRSWPWGKQKGGAVLTFGGAHVQDARALHLGDGAGVGYWPRTVDDAVVTTAAGTAVRVLGAHVSGTGPGADADADDGGTAGIDAELGPVAATVPAWHGATVLAGDFNTRSGTPAGDHEAALLGAVGLRDAMTSVGLAGTDPARASWPTDGPFEAIDRIYASADVRVHDVHVVDDPRARAGSDHLPVVADLQLGHATTTSPARGFTTPPAPPLAG